MKADFFGSFSQLEQFYAAWQRQESRRHVSAPGISWEEEPSQFSPLLGHLRYTTMGGVISNPVDDETQNEIEELMKTILSTQDVGIVNMLSYISPFTTQTDLTSP